MMVPAARLFKEHFPDTVLDLLTSAEAAPLFEKETLFDQVLIFKNNWFIKSATGSRWKEVFTLWRRLRKNRYDAAVDFRGDLRTILLMSAAGIPERAGYTRTGGGFLLTRAGKFEKEAHQEQLNLALLKFFDLEAEAGVRAPFRIAEEEKESFWEGSGRGILLQTSPILVVHAGAGRPEKVWETAKFRRVVEKMLADKLGQVILIGTEADKKAFGEIKYNHAHLTDLRGKTGLRELLVLLSAADIFVGTDSGPAHLAALQGTRVVSIFKGPNAPAVWHPLAAKLYLVTHPDPCPACGASPCPRRAQACLETISARRVYEALLEAWRDTLLDYPFVRAVQPSLEEF